VLLLLANEAARLKFLGLSLKFALLGLWLPVLRRRRWCRFSPARPACRCSSPRCSRAACRFAPPRVDFRLSAPDSFPRARRQILVPLGAVLTGFLAFYLFRLVPPVPLSIPFIGVYHTVERSGQGYRLIHERPAWRCGTTATQSFARSPATGLRFLRIFSPTRLLHEVVVRWYGKTSRRRAAGCCRIRCPSR